MSFHLDQMTSAVYGLGKPVPGLLTDGVVPAIFEITGAMSTSAMMLCQHLVDKRSARLAHLHSMPFSLAWRRAAQEMWPFLGVAMQRTRWQAECVCDPSLRCLRVGPAV